MYYDVDANNMNSTIANRNKRNAIKDFALSEWGYTLPNSATLFETVVRGNEIP